VSTIHPLLSITVIIINTVIVETMDKYFESVCELDIMFHIDKGHHILDEMVSNGAIIENNKTNILKPLALIDKASEESFFSMKK